MSRKHLGYLDIISKTMRNYYSVLVRVDLYSQRNAPRSP